VRGKRFEEWTHTAQILATIANIVRDKKKRARAYTMADFHPEKDKIKRAERANAIPATFKDLKNAFGLDKDQSPQSVSPDGGQS